ncbi:MAG: hypothetical protein DDT22_01101 [candidate division WS2 bacterium]|nr:hypothetical protein [Candidatus Lithacetigena glycinireducens]MBT9175425.1 hypothetical protein [Candidatus Lithacetigena glycinireducens]
MDIKLLPTIQEWRNLYAMAVKFKEIEPWNWMWDSDIFGVQNPYTGEIGYCCITGRLGVHFGLVVYLGTEGLDMCWETQAEEKQPEDFELIDLQKCLTASFEDRRYLEKPDLDLIKVLGLRFKGHNAWPLFRNYCPGYIPWFLSKEEVEYLTLALEQAIHVAVRFKEDEDLLTAQQEGIFFVRIPEITTDNIITWKDGWLKPAPLETKHVVLIDVPEIHLERIRKSAVHQNQIWEADSFPIPTFIKDRERPYYLYGCVFIDKNSSFVLAAEMIKPQEYHNKFVGLLLKAMEEFGIIPKQIFVKKEEAFELLQPITSRLNIELKIVKRLPELERFKSELIKSLSR